MTLSTIRQESVKLENAEKSNIDDDEEPLMENDDVSEIMHKNRIDFQADDDDFDKIEIPQQHPIENAKLEETREIRETSEKHNVSKMNFSIL